jgi:hypothetical protein
MEIYQNQYLVSCFSKGLLYLHRGMFADLLTNHLTFSFLVKIQLFITLKLYQDPDPHGSLIVWLPGFGSGSALRSKAGSGSALKPMLIHKTGLTPSAKKK